MIFTRENCKPIESPTEAQIARALSLTKSSFAALARADGAYVQVAGGPGLFLVERRDSSGQHYRAAQATPVVPFPDGTILSFSAGNVALARNEWFLAKQATEILVAFLAGASFPVWLQWSTLSASYAHAS
jgi:hypothetical protein